MLRPRLPRPSVLRPTSAPRGPSPPGPIPAGRLSGRDLAFAALLVVVAAALRLYRLDTGLWYDEIVTLVESVRRPLAVIATSSPGDNQHPLYSVLARLSILTFGEEPWALRLPAVIFGVAAVPLLYIVGLQVSERREAGAAALILAVSYHHVWFSQNARAYTAILFGALLTTSALLRWLDGGARRHLAVFVGATALGAYAHPTVVLVAVGQAVACAAGWITDGPASRLRTGWRSLAAAFVGAAGLTVLLYAPMLADVGSAMAEGTTAGRDTTSVGWALGSLLQGLRAGFGAVPAVLLGAAVFAAGAVSYLRQRPLVALLFALPVLITAGVALALGRPIRPRFVFFGIGFALLFTVRGAATLGVLQARWTGGAVAPARAAHVLVLLLTIGAVVVSLRSLAYNYRYPKQDYAGAAEVIDRNAAAGDAVAVVADGGAIPLVQYMERPWTRVDTAADLQRLRGRGRPVWVAFTFASYIRAGQPDLWAMLEHCPEVRRVPATVEDGSISIRRCP